MNLSIIILPFLILASGCSLELMSSQPQKTNPSTEKTPQETLFNPTDDSGNDNGDTDDSSNDENDDNDTADTGDEDTDSGGEPVSAFPFRTLTSQGFQVTSLDSRKQFDLSNGFGGNSFCASFDLSRVDLSKNDFGDKNILISFSDHEEVDTGSGCQLQLRILGHKYGSDGDGNFKLSAGCAGVTMAEPRVHAARTWDPSKTYHFLIQVNNGAVKIFVDGKSIDGLNSNIGSTSSNFRHFWIPNSGTGDLKGLPDYGIINGSVYKNLTVSNNPSGC